MPAHSFGLSVADVDAKLRTWRQGDLLFGTELPFVTFAHPLLPLTAVSRDVVQDRDDDSTTTAVDVLSDELGYAIVSQSCDLIRTCADRPYVELAPLVRVDASKLAQAQRGRSERYAPHSLVAGESLVVDLDRIMVVEKPVLAALAPHNRRTGLTDGERRRFAQALARKRGRFAFPDDFVAGIRKLRDHIVAKHGKDSALGGFLAAVTEIRVYCPDWTATEPKVTLLFMFDEEAQIPGDGRKHADALKTKFTPTGVFQELAVKVASFETMSAARYRNSDLLELDFLSQAGRAND